MNLFEEFILKREIGYKIKKQKRNFINKINSEMELCSYKEIKSCHKSGINTLSIDHSDKRL
jgi:hypothetical protein